MGVVRVSGVSVLFLLSGVGGLTFLLEHCNTRYYLFAMAKRGDTELIAQAVRRKLQDFGTDYTVVRKAYRILATTDCESVLSGEFQVLQKGKRTLMKPVGNIRVVPTCNSHLTWYWCMPGIFVSLSEELCMGVLFFAIPKR